MAFVKKCSHDCNGICSCPAQGIIHEHSATGQVTEILFCEQGQLDVVSVSVSCTDCVFVDLLKCVYFFLLWHAHHH